MRKMKIVIVCIMLITTFSYIFPIKISVADPPGVPGNPNPQNGSSNVSINIDLSWTCIDPDPGDNLTYDVYLGKNSTPLIIAHNISDSRYIPSDPLEYDTEYYWRIVAWDRDNNCSNGSLWNFTTGIKPNQPPDVPSDPNPSNGSLEVSVNANLSWICSDPDGDTLTYDVYFGVSSSPPKVASNITASTYNPETMNNGTIYYWKIVAWDIYSGSNASSVWHFQTNSLPNQPSNPIPSNGSTGVSVNVDLSWIGGDPDPGDTVLYDVYFGTTSSPSIVSHNQSGLSYDPGTLAFNTSYYWMIVAWDSHGASAVGLLWNFTTGVQPNSPPYIPTSPSPKNSSTGVSVNADLSWTGGDPDPGDTVKYDVYFGTSSSPPKKVINQTTTSYDPGTMGYSTTYYWKITAWDSHDNSTTSALFHFKTAAQSGGGGEEPPQEPQNIKPIADASAGEPYRADINSTILFDGSRSYDPDGNITIWLWDFGDNTKVNGMTVYHSFLEAGIYTVTLTVTDNKGASNTDMTTCVIKQRNQPPTIPTIEGPTGGTKNTMYTYTAASTDPDNDPLQYTFEWGGSISQSSGFLPNTTSYSVNHSWAVAGRYNLTVTVTDNQTESFSKIIVYIDAVQARGAGYLLDNDGDGIYDAFYSDETHQTVSIQNKDDSYLIDKDGDGTWDYVYNATYGLTSYQEPRKTPGFELMFVPCAIAVAIIVWRKKRIV